MLIKTVFSIEQNEIKMHLLSALLIRFLIYQMKILNIFKINIVSIQLKKLFISGHKKIIKIK